jgi:D-alanyl-D-alanine dipeptidase
MTLIDISPPEWDVVLALAYATPNNVTGKPIYAHARCYLHPDAAAALGRAIELARALGLRLKIFDAFRPSEAQWMLWNKFPDPEFLADPRRGSPHSRGVAIDLTLIDAEGRELEMGTLFDDFTPRAHHANLEVSAAAQRNRALLLGLMTAAGWDFYRNEWWHYQLFNPRRYPVWSDSALPEGRALMARPLMPLPAA